MTAGTHDRHCEHEQPLVVRGFSPADIRRQAARRCTPGCHLVEQCVTPCLVSPGGRVRLYEGRFLLAD
jgi:hypothetical protein